MSGASLKIENPTTAIAAVKLLLESSVPARLAMQGTSMLPLLREPMVLELAPVSGRISIGQIVVFERDGTLVAHRVTAVRNGRIETCGDARPWSPEFPATQAIVGKVIAVRANDAADAPRIDSSGFRLRGAAYAHTRSLRAFGCQTASFWRRVLGALPWRRQRSYPTLVALMSAVVRGDRVDFENALASADPAGVCALARRHACSAPLLHALTTFGPSTKSADYLRRALQPAGRNAVLVSMVARSRLNEVTTALTQAGIDFALLKGAARLYRDEPGSALHASGDFDILVPSQQLDSAIDALHAQGYDEGPYAARRTQYRERHHHAAPLMPPGNGFAVELHTSLAPPWMLSTLLDWGTLRGLMEPVAGHSGDVLCLNRLGTALHLAVHSIGLTRLRDTVLLAPVLAALDSSAHEELRRIVAAERLEPVRLGASFVLAARMAKIPWPASTSEERYLEWVARREDVPIYCAQRSQLVEGWYAAGGRFTRQALRLMNPSVGLVRDSGLRTLRSIAGRPLAGVCAFVYTRLMSEKRRKREPS